MKIKITHDTVEIKLENILQKELILARRDNSKKLKTGNITIVNPEIPQLPDIYFLFDKHKKLLYVGQGQNIQKRIAVHLSENNANPATDMNPKEISLSFYIIQ